MPVINLKQLKIDEPTRNFDSSLDENINISAENNQGLFGAFKFFSGIRSFFKGISALGTLASGSRLPVTDSNGNVTYTTMNDINTYVVNNALTKYQKFVNYDFNISSNSKYKLAKISITSKGHANLKVFISSRIGNKVANDGEYSIKIGYLNAYNKIISVNGNEQTDTYFTIEKEDDNNYYLVLNVNTTSSSPIMGNIKVEEVSSAYATVTLPESLTSFTETTTEIVNSKGKIVATLTDLNNAFVTEYNKNVIGEITISANGTYTNTNIDIEKSGYDVIMPIIAVTGNNAVYCYNQGYVNGKMVVQLKNTSNSAVTITPLANIIYKKK